MDFAIWHSEWTYTTGALITLLFIVDPFAAVPVFITLTERFGEHDREGIRRKATLVALAMLLTFAVSGLGLFQLFGITLPAFQIAGGLLLFLLGIAQLNAAQKKVTSAEAVESRERDDVTIFPLATPILAGPGAISTVVLLSTKASSPLRRIELMVAVVVCLVACYAVLRSATYLQRLLGTTGLNLLSRVMGIVLCAVAVQFVLNGLREALPRLAG